MDSRWGSWIDGKMHRRLSKIRACLLLCGLAGLLLVAAPGAASGHSRTIVRAPTAHKRKRHHEINKTGFVHPPAWVIQGHLQSKIHFYPAPGAKRSSDGAHRFVTRSPLDASHRRARRHGFGGANISLGRNYKEGEPPLVNPGNGPVQTTAHVYLILWGSNWNNTDLGLRSALENFYRGAFSSYSEWSGILRQYCGPTGCPSGATLSGVWVDPQYLHPTGVNDANIQGEVNRAVNTPGSAWAGAEGDPNAQFIVVPSHYSTYAAGFRSNFCGYHGVFANATYTFLPDIADSSSPFGFSVCSYSGDRNATDAETGVASHEFSESVSDPQINAWHAVGAPYGEVADLCTTGHDQYRSSGTWVNGSWDDHLNNCALYDSNPPPVVPTDPPDGASGITETSATLNANVNPNGTQTHAYFEYGTTTKYGTTVPSSSGVAVGAGTESVLVNEHITGLEPGTTYHFRSVVYNSWSGNIYGPDQTFTTPEVEGSSRWAVRDPSTGYQWVYYVGSESALSEWFWNGQTWVNSKVGGQVATGTNTTAVRDPSTGYQWVYYVGSESALREQFWNGQTWVSSKVGGQIAAGTSPTVVRDPSTGYQWVYYVGSESVIWEYFWNGQTWVSSKVGSKAAEHTSPTVVRDPSTGYQWVDYVGNNSSISQFFWNGQTWVSSNVGGQVAAGTSLTTMRDPNNGYIWVDYVGSNSAIWQWFWNGQTWVSSSVGGAVAPKTSIALLRDPNTSYQWIYYTGSNSAIWSWFWTTKEWVASSP